MSAQLPSVKFYIASKNAIYSLRMISALIGAQVDDSHIISLGQNQKKAKSDAGEIVTAIRTLISPDLLRIDFNADANPHPIKSVFKSSQDSSNAADLLEMDLMPYGTFAGQEIKTIDTAYLSSCIDQVAKTPQLNARRLAGSVIGVLALRGELTESNLSNFFLSNAVSKKELNKFSEYVGSIKERLEIEAVIELEKAEMNVHRNRMHYFYKLRYGQNSMMYSGSTKLDAKGGIVRLRATIKEHHLYKGIKITVIERPKVL